MEPVSILKSAEGACSNLRETLFDVGFGLRQAHALAEELGLGHESRGQGVERRIVVWLPQAELARGRHWYSDRRRQR
jgi:hypothetical protein